MTPATWMVLSVMSFLVQTDGSVPTEEGGKSFSKTITSSRSCFCFCCSRLLASLHFTVLLLLLLFADECCCCMRSFSRSCLRLFWLLDCICLIFVWRILSASVDAFRFRDRYQSGFSFLASKLFQIFKRSLILDWRGPKGSAETETVCCCFFSLDFSLHDALTASIAAIIWASDSPLLFCIVQRLRSSSSSIRANWFWCASRIDATFFPSFWTCLLILLFVTVFLSNGMCWRNKRMDKAIGRVVLAFFSVKDPSIDLLFFVSYEEASASHWFKIRSPPAAKKSRNRRLLLCSEAEAAAVAVAAASTSGVVVVVVVVVVWEFCSRAVLSAFSSR
mmetsp:Transcript_11009/g.27904  ORF Transcript_11009/g.27904 Transcript_11009/m.27904 type:complete len:333 (-) Transcript_11009:800-1798(-)